MGFFGLDAKAADPYYPHIPHTFQDKTMAQLHFYVPDEIEAQIRNKAKQAQLPLSRYLANLVKQEAGQPSQWPAGYFEQVFGGWQGEPLQRPPQGEQEQREALK